MMQAEDTSRKDKPPSTIHRRSTMMLKRLLVRGREPKKQKEGSTIKKLAEYIAARRQVKIIVK